MVEKAKMMAMVEQYSIELRELNERLNRTNKLAISKQQKQQVLKEIQFSKSLMNDHYAKLLKNSLNFEKFSELFVKQYNLIFLSDEMSSNSQITKVSSDSGNVNDLFDNLKKRKKFKEDKSNAKKGKLEIQQINLNNIITK